MREERDYTLKGTAGLSQHILAGAKEVCMRLESEGARSSTVGWIKNSLLIGGHLPDHKIIHTGKVLRRWHTLLESRKKQQLIQSEVDIPDNWGK